MFLGDEQLVLQPLFGSEERLQQSTPTPGDQNVPDLALFYRVRGGESRAQEPRSRIAALPGIDTAYVKPGAVPATVADDDRRLKEGAPVTPDFSSRQGCLGPAPEGIDPTGHGSGPLAEGPAQRPRPAGLSAA